MAIKRRSKLHPKKEPLPVPPRLHKKRVPKHEEAKYKALIKDVYYWQRERKKARNILDRLGLPNADTQEYRDAQEQWSTANEALEHHRRHGNLPSWAI